MVTKDYEFIQRKINEVEAGKIKQCDYPILLTRLLRKVDLYTTWDYVFILLITVMKHNHRNSPSIEIVTQLKEAYFKRVTTHSPFVSVDRWLVELELEEQKCRRLPVPVNTLRSFMIRSLGDPSYTKPLLLLLNDMLISHNLPQKRPGILMDTIIYKNTIVNYGKFVVKRQPKEEPQQLVLNSKQLEIKG